MKFLDIKGVQTLWNTSKETFVPQNIMVTNIPLNVYDYTFTVVTCPSPWPTGQFCIVHDTTEDTYQLAYRSTRGEYYTLCMSLTQMAAQVPSLLPTIALLFPNADLSGAFPALSPTLSYGRIFHLTSGNETYLGKYFISVPTSRTILGGNELLMCDTLDEAYRKTLANAFGSADTAIESSWLNTNLT